MLDCTAIPANHTGVGRYLEGLLSGLDPDDLTLTLVVHQRDFENLSKSAPWANTIIVPRILKYRPLRLTWEQLALPLIARKLGADIVHSPHYTFPLAWRRGRVVTIHDATFFSEPRSHDIVKRTFFRAWTRLAWALAGAVVTPSRATAREIQRFLGLPKAEVAVALLAVNPKTFYPPSEEQVIQFRSLIGLDPDTTWFAFLGTIEPRKNLVSLLEAYRLFREETPQTPPQMLISGGRGWDKEAIAALNTLPKDSGVHELGYLPIEQLPALLGGSVAVLYPSLGEGFGLPTLEAMACGSAVITSDRLAIPEVGGDAVVYAGTDARSIADAMGSLLANDPERKELRSKAYKRAAGFTWTETAKAHIRAYLASIKPTS